MYGSGVVFEFVAIVFGDADFASPKVMYLSFYRSVSAHLLTVPYHEATSFV